MSFGNCISTAGTNGGHIALTQGQQEGFVSMYQIYMCVCTEGQREREKSHSRD